LRVLDLFSGSGAFGIEAISRGATEAVLIEKDLRAADTLHTNVANFGLKNARVVIADAFSDVAQKSGRGTFDVVFIDPPYSFEDQDVDALIANLVKNDWLNEFALIVVERGSRSQVQWPDSVEELRKKVYGDTSIWYGQYLTSNE
jgi:16S rRNA (guanine966-N2)-methyltransferase